MIILAEHSIPTLAAKPREQWNALDHLGYWLGVGLGSGLSPRAPGTMGSLAVLLLVPVWVWLGGWGSVLVVVLMSLSGVWICGHAARLLGVHDDGRIVWDEFCGQSLALLPLVFWWPKTATLDSGACWLDVLVAFAAFRLFDVWKPWPIGWLDRHVDGGLGIMADDLLAGVMAIGVVWLWWTQVRPPTGWIF